MIDLSPSLVEVNRVCGSVSGGGVCYSGDSVGSVAVYFCDDGYTLDGDSTRECLSSGLWNGTTPQCVERDRDGILFECKNKILHILLQYCASVTYFTAFTLYISTFSLSV